MLKKQQTAFSEHEIFYIDRDAAGDIPPFQLFNRDVLKIIKSLGLESKFKRYIKQKHYPAIVLFKKEIAGKTYILGWSHDKLKLDRKGLTQWERISIENIRNQGSTSVLRLSPDVYSGERLAMRTAGQPYAEPLKLVIAGLGSIGSNLIFFLNSFENPEFRLVDTELLEIENIGRHLLGLDSVNMYKTSGIENYIVQKRPHQKVLTSNDSIIDLIKNQVGFVNDSDFIFIAVGPGNTQDWIGLSIYKKIIMKPVFFIWVEPYLTGGHCIYIHPDSGLDYSSFFDEEGYFKFNIIDSSEYRNGNPHLSMKEAGCQTSYTPYPISNIILFLSQLFPKINQLITEGTPISCSYTWFGARQALCEKGIKISSYGNANEQGGIRRNSFDEN